MQDRSWLDAFRRGERAALERVFRSYAPLVTWALRRGMSGTGGGARVFLTDRGLEDDLLQEVFLRLLTPAARDRYDGLRPFSALVYTVTRNALIDHMRKNAGRDRVTDPLDQDVTTAQNWRPGAPIPDEVALSQEEQRGVAGFIAGLHDQERHYFALRYQQGASQQQAADGMGISRQTVRTLERRIHDQVRAFLRG
jgi:RNA polymerase sigma-70 factor (ECF subfamily)